MWYVHVLQSQSKANWFYKGSTNYLERRKEQHDTGKVISSKLYRPFRLVYYEAYVLEDAAR
jgi:putative endonuclease